MKKLLFIGILFFISCESNLERRELSQYKLEGHSVYVYTIDSCEYIKIPQGQATWGAHKGDCKNPIHPENKNK